MNVAIDRTTCVGCGQCSDICPTVFEMDGGKAVPAINPVPVIFEYDCRRAIDTCPTTAISERAPHAFMIRRMSDAVRWVAI